MRPRTCEKSHAYRKPILQSGLANHEHGQSRILEHVCTSSVDTAGDIVSHWAAQGGIDSQSLSLYCVCMTYRGDADRVIEDAVKAIGDVASKALRAGDYGAAADIARMLEALSAAVATSSHTQAPSEPQPTRESPKPSKVTARRGNGGSKGSAAKRKASSREYPRFERDGDKLVKIGWSKKAREEYEHRASIGVAECLLAAIGQKHQPGELFAAVDILPLKDGHGGAVPDYQSYLALKWLHSEGVVTKHGRDRYAIEPGHLDDDTLKRLWAGLPKFNGASR